ncbi:MAG: nuclear transport factor 2 family protein [Gammaproteobacteria bacterium]|nr:nuclear transport factor 2 family protein [Gammaproteobacteria bacterium]
MSVENIKSKQEIIKTFLSDMAKTASQHDFEKHMNLISKKVEVFGVPGFESISYDDWFKQCENEFSEKLIKAVSYENIDIIDSTESVIMFKTIEHIETKDKTQNATDVVIVITREDDGKWRVTQERILPTDELAQNKNYSLN